MSSQVADSAILIALPSIDGRLGTRALLFLLSVIAPAYSSGLSRSVQIEIPRAADEPQPGQPW